MSVSMVIWLCSPMSKIRVKKLFLNVFVITDKWPEKFVNNTVSSCYKDFVAAIMINSVLYLVRMSWFFVKKSYSTFLV
jgi:hypothetical protein